MIFFFDPRNSPSPFFFIPVDFITILSPFRNRFTSFPNHACFTLRFSLNSGSFDSSVHPSISPSTGTSVGPPFCPSTYHHAPISSYQPDRNNIQTRPYTRLKSLLVGRKIHRSKEWPTDQSTDTPSYRVAQSLTQNYVSTWSWSVDFVLNTSTLQHD